MALQQQRLSYEAGHSWQRWSHLSWVPICKISHSFSQLTIYQRTNESLAPAKQPLAAASKTHPITFFQEVLGPVEILLDRKMPQISSDSSLLDQYGSVQFDVKSNCRGVEKVWGAIHFLRRAWRISPKADNDILDIHVVSLSLESPNEFVPKWRPNPQDMSIYFNHFQLISGQTPGNIKNHRPRHCDKFLEFPMICIDLLFFDRQIDEIYHQLSYRLSTAASILAQSDFLHEARPALLIILPGFGDANHGGKPLLTSDTQALRQLSEQDLSTPSAHIRCRWQDIFVEFPLRSSAATCGDALALATFEIIWVFSTQLLNIWGSTFSGYMSLVTFLFCCRRLAREGFTMGALAFNSHLCSDGCTYPQTNCPWSKQRALAGVGIEDPKTLRSLEEGLEASHSVSLLANSVARDREHS